MLPRWHLILGALFTFAIWLISPETRFIYLALIFLATILIDFDHYLVAVVRTGKVSLAEAFNYHEMCKIKREKLHKKGVRKKGDFHIFHTIEFHVLIGILGVFFLPFFYIFLGMVFHSLTDVFYMLHKDIFYGREFFFFSWLRKNI